MKQWHALTIEETEKLLAKETHYGINELKDIESVYWYHILVRQFTNILILALLLATILSFILGDMIDAIAILVIIIFNGLLGFIQEWKAHTAIQKLKKMLSPKCRIIRDGKEEIIHANKLIPGDRVLLDAGNIVPADIRLIRAVNLMVNEAALTGESAPIAKITKPLPKETILLERKNMAYMGTHVVNGHGQGLVVAIGMNTEFGRIAKMTGTIIEEKTTLQKQLSNLGRQFGFLALFISATVILIGMLFGHDIINLLLTGVSLAVATIPEGLPAVVTIALAVGARAMSHKKALLRQLQAAETLGAVSVICTDKTGTLTKNEMKVQKIWLQGEFIDITGTSYEPKGEFIAKGQSIDPKSIPGLIVLLDTGRKCNHARIHQEETSWKAIGSPDEAALIVAALKSGLSQEYQSHFINEFTFDSTRKRMSIIEETEECQIVHVKGAPEVILPLCTHYLTRDNEIKLMSQYQLIIEKAYNNFAEEGLRTLALARKVIPKQAELTVDEAESNLTFLGIVGLIDPPRKEVPDALETAKKAGIKVIMITGDSPVTAHAIAKQIGLNIQKIVTSSELEKINDNNLNLLLKEDILFARTIPKDKLRIVSLLQKQGQLVAMTGDGVNDAPALKQADIGIAMGIRGTDVARSVADIVLLDDNFASIIAAVKEGRRQYTNIRKFVLFLASSNIGEALAVLINIMLSGRLIMVPIQILWINLITDSATALSLSVEEAEKDIMSTHPRQANQSILDRTSFFLLGLFGSYIGIVTFLIYKFYSSQSYALANTIAFTTLAVMSNIHALNFRNLYKPIKEIGWFSNKWILIAISSMLGLQIAAIYTPGLQRILHTVPISIMNWSVIIICSLPLFLLPELYKYLKNLKDNSK
ncbi:cation-translocating P-type ATPase [Legionella sp. PC1000]|uniref:cation-translocating P-type ATPase n=1 Tax=Legionella sp. PC1000 TaxID=2746060 RepID=UPI0015FE2B6F|nr:cation-transporting P-type ATPase [Legionella sp. PC1000]QLZ68522.1 cation-translocating P-type ATPase [Legionella sp. PC1000]